MLNIAVLVSGGGTNLQALIDAQDRGEIKNGKITFPAGCSGTISVFCMGPDALGVTEKGLFYGLEDAKLTSGFPLGVSNHFTCEPADISVKYGSLLVLWEKRNGFPGR